MRDLTRYWKPTTRRRLLVLAAVGVAAVSMSKAQDAPAWRFAFLGKTDGGKANELLAGRGCPCGCGRYLPGSKSEPACFGCSVGKAEVSRVAEGLRDGKPPGEIILELGEGVLIDVFADYTDEGLSELWRTARETAADLGQHRVVLRTPGYSEDARRAIRLAECARDEGRFFVVQQALIDHIGPWDVATLVRLAGRHHLDPEKVGECLEKKDIHAQVAKDNEHAGWFGIRRYPGLAVNRQSIDTTAEALRRAIRETIEDNSI